MIRLGVLDFDTSHVVEFTKRLNHVGIGEDQWVEGARVVIGCPGESKIMPERIPGYIKQMKDLGVPLVDRPEEMIGKVDGMLIESQEGTVHYDRAKPFLEGGIPCFIDKPFTCSVDHARKLIDLARRQNVPIFSSSSLRYAPELTRFVEERPLGNVIGALAYGPASENPRNPGLFHYGIHAVEILYTLMGSGCERVQCVYEKTSEISTGRWKDGRLASIRGIRQGAGAYGATVFCERGVVSLDLKTTYIYRELLKQIVRMFQTGKPPVDPEVSLEIVGFIEAARRSGANHGSNENVLTRN